MSFELPEDWCKQPLEDLCERVSVGYVGETTCFFTGKAEGVPLIRSQNVRPNRVDVSDIKHITRSFHEKSKKSQLVGGDLLIVRVGQNRGDCAVLPDGMGDVNCANIVFARPDRRYSDFLAAYFNTPRGHDALLSVSSGSAQLVLNTKAVAKIEVPVPPVDEAQAIGDLSSAFDRRIALLSETNVTLEAIAQVLFKSWFVDFDPVRAKMEGRAPEGMTEAIAALFPDGFEESELGLVPRGWKIGPIGDSISVVDFVANGSFASLKENVALSNEPSYALYLRTTDFNNGYSGNFRYITKSAYEFLSKSSLDGSEVVISNVGDVGTIFRPPTWLGYPMTLGSNAVALKAKKLSAFMYFYFSGEKGQHDIQSIVTGSAQLKFNKTNFRSLLIAMPEPSVLEIFESIAGGFLSKIDNNCAHIKSLSTLRDFLLPRLISGQLRLPNSKAQIDALAA